MKNVFVFCVLMPMLHQTAAQPGEARTAYLKLSFINGADTICFQRDSNKYRSLDGEFELSFFEQEYDWDMEKFDKCAEEFQMRNKEDPASISDCELERIKKDSLISLRRDLMKSGKIFRYAYNPSIQCLGDKYVQPLRDFIVRLKNKNYNMTVIFELYSAKSSFSIRDTASTHLTVCIPFQKGEFKVIDTLNPDLILITRDDEREGLFNL